MDNKKDQSVRQLTEEMFQIQLKANQFMKSLTREEELSDNLVFLLLKLKWSEFLKVTEIAEFFLLTPGAATNMCDKLERLGLVERIRLKEDRRVVRVALTKKGEERVHDIFAKFSAEQLETVISSLTQIRLLFEKIEDTL
ncbi:MarR family winged helix-turn-helix transcriptional regulator [Domibacillus indicus]|uniref:MarR family winged helix-turn-helix transcriptional regulator n=1 Tax=Domibacillus indicus TaxID=1437523 RepID=UPI0006180B33|nr:MarR family transcriptional regulator [Domibacillus indicus]